MASDRIRREVQVDDHIVVPQGASVVNVDVVSYIHNDGQEHYAVGGTGARHAWQVLDESQRVIYREATTEEGPGGALIPGSLFIREAETLEIPASKLGNGKRYTVRHLHFGHAAEAQFVAVREPAKPAAKKKAAKKKAAKRKK